MTEITLHPRGNRQHGVGFRLLLPLFLLALTPRILVTAVFVDLPIGLDDMFQYDMLARSIALGNGYRWYQREEMRRHWGYFRRYYGLDIPIDRVPENGVLTTFRAPGYPLFLAGVYRLGGMEGRLENVRWLQVVIGASLAPLTAWLGTRLQLSRRACTLAGAVVGLYPMLWVYPLALASENIFIPLLILGLASLSPGSRGPMLGQAIVAGLVLGAATLTRGSLVVFLPLAGLWVWRRGSARLALVYCISAGAMLIPWSVRNSAVMGRPAFVETTLGYNLFIGYHPEGDGGFRTEVAILPLKIFDDGLRDQWAIRHAMGFIRSDPWRAVRLMFARLAQFWGLEGRELIYFYSNDYIGPLPISWLLVGYLILVIPQIAIFSAAPPGYLLVAHPGRRLLAGLVAASMLAYVPILADARFHMPLLPILALLAGAAWSTAGLPATWIGRLRDGKRGWWAALVLLLALLALWSWGLWANWPKLVAVFSPGGNELRLHY